MGALAHRRVEPIAPSNSTATNQPQRFSSAACNMPMIHATTMPVTSATSRNSDARKIAMTERAGGEPSQPRHNMAPSGRRFPTEATKGSQKHYTRRDAQDHMTRRVSIGSLLRRSLAKTAEESEEGEQARGPFPLQRIALLASGYS